MLTHNVFSSDHENYYSLRSRYSYWPSFFFGGFLGFIAGFFYGIEYGPGEPSVQYFLPFIIGGIAIYQVLSWLKQKERVRISKEALDGKLIEPENPRFVSGYLPPKGDYQKYLLRMVHPEESGVGDAVMEYIGNAVEEGKFYFIHNTKCVKITSESNTITGYEQTYSGNPRNALRQAIDNREDYMGGGMNESPYSITRTEFSIFFELEKKNLEYQKTKFGDEVLDEFVEGDNYNIIAETLPNNCIRIIRYHPVNY